jgi:MFS family permease
MRCSPSDARRIPRSITGARHGRHRHVHVGALWQWVNTLLPLLSDALNTSTAGIEKVTTIYLDVISGLLLDIGRAGDLFGHQRLLLAGFALFVVSLARRARTRMPVSRSAPLIGAMTSAVRGDTRVTTAD